METTAHAVTDDQAHVLAHALTGGRVPLSQAYRNHYLAGPGHHQWQACRELVLAGLMEDAGPTHRHGHETKDHLFTVTPAGYEAAASHGGTSRTLLPAHVDGIVVQTPYQRACRARTAVLALPPSAGVTGAWVRKDGEDRTAYTLVVQVLVPGGHRPDAANHFCPGETGTGEWSCRSEVPSVCGYCRRPNASAMADEFGLAVEIAEVEAELALVPPETEGMPLRLFTGTCRPRDAN